MLWLKNSAKKDVKKIFSDNEKCKIWFHVPDNKVYVEGYEKYTDRCLLSAMRVFKQEVCSKCNNLTHCAAEDFLKIYPHIYQRVLLSHITADISCRSFEAAGGK